MDRKEIEEIITRIKLAKFKIQDILGSNTDMTKVIVLGVTGSGKSSLTSCLVKENVIVKEGAGRKALLGGSKYIGDGCESYTKEPAIIIDKLSNIMYIDCPGFEDTESYKQEVVNSFIIDYLFEMSSKCKFTILLVISQYEFDASRGQGITNTLSRMNEMFPKPGELEQGIGLVITKGEIDLTSNDYIEIMEENSSENVQKWCQFFKNNLDRVFVFPQAQIKDVNKPYEFEDQFSLEQFIKNNHVIDPIHKIALSYNAKLYMTNIGTGLAQTIKDVIHFIFNKIIDNYLTDKKSFYLKKWLKWMNGLKNRNIKNSNELKIFLHDYFPGNGKYNYYIGCLNDNENMNTFIYKVFDKDYCNNVLEETVSKLVSNCLEELETLYEKAKICEQNEAKRIELEKMIEMKKKKIEEEIQKEKMVQVEIDRKKIEIEQQRIQIENLKRQVH